MPQFYVGTCAFTDHEGLYPPGVKPADRLRYYSREFNLVEVDAPFYRALSAAVSERWASVVPEAFRFDVKAPGSLTGHRPADARELAVFRQFLDPLARRGLLGAVLLQWPPWFHASADHRLTLELARDALQPYLVAVEFRHRSWYRDGLASAVARDLGSPLVTVDAPDAGDTTVQWDPAVTSPHLAYVRFHGRNAETWSQPGLSSSQERFFWRYSADELDGPLPDLRAMGARAAAVHVLMNNNYGSYAVDGARYLRDRLSPLPGAQMRFFD
jgi:uncharacterized protein YecE (DUF72 family)